MSDSNTSVDRDTLYEEVWTDPVSVVAPRYGLSDVGLAKICRALAIPLPSRGYWAKVRAGRVMKRIPLPKLKQSGPVLSGLVKLPRDEVTALKARKSNVTRIRKETPAMAPPEEDSPWHPLVKAASKRLRQRDGWPENTLLRSAPKEVLHLSVTKESLDRALGIADSVLKALAKQGFDVEIDDKQGMTRLKWLETGTTMEFSLSEYVRRTRHEITPAEERARKRYWERSRWGSSVPFPHAPMYDFTPTGVLTILVGRWPSRSWKDTPRTQLEARLGEVVGGTVALAQEIHAKEQEEARRAEAHRQAVARYEFLTKRRAGEVERFKNLESQATNWERATKLRAYIDAWKKQTEATGELSHEQADWLHWARAKADWLDPLIQVSDVILDAPEPRQPSRW